jgi:hypothetical protein
MEIIFNLPIRQKLLMILTIAVGLIIIFCSATNTMTDDNVNTFIFAYSIGVPFSLLCFPTIIDLNNKKVFLTWLAISTILLLISIATKNNPKFIIYRSSQFDSTDAFNSSMSDHSTSALKSLFIFLIAYWILNELSKKTTGDFIVNTFRQKTLTSQDANRKFTGMDIISNIILYLVIFGSALF